MVRYPQILTGACLFGVVGYQKVIYDGSDFGQMFAAAERTDPTGPRLAQLVCVGTLLAGRLGANARM